LRIGYSGRSINSIVINLSLPEAAVTLCSLSVVVSFKNKVFTELEYKDEPTIFL
jgi:hypothetical protein